MTSRRIILIAIISSSFVASYVGKRLLAQRQEKISSHEAGGGHEVGDTKVIPHGSGKTATGRSLTNAAEPGAAANPSGPEIPPESPTPPLPTRIISMAPSITEILFAIGCGDRLVGATRYCDYPPEALKVPRIGGYFDPHYEAILAANPDLLILLPEHVQSMPQLETLKLNTLSVSHIDIEGILASIATIGARCGKQAKARQMVDDIRARMECIRLKTRNLDRPSVLISVGRNMGTGAVNDVFTAAEDGFYSALIRLAGGQNAYAGPDVKFPKLSVEGILLLEPDVIIDMTPDLKDSEIAGILGEWEKLKELKAVKNKRVYVFNKGHCVIPGPRFVLLLEDLARAIHPEIEWGSK